MQAHGRWQRASELGDSVIEQRNANLKGDRHAHPVNLRQDVIRKINLDIVQAQGIEFARQICPEDLTRRACRVWVVQGGQEVRPQQLAVPEFSVAPHIVLKRLERETAKKALAPDTPGEC